MSASGTLNLLRAFADPVADSMPDAKADARTIMRWIEDNPRLLVDGLGEGLTLSVSAWVVDPLMGTVYLQKHPYTGEMWPCGGKPKPGDKRDPLRTGAREFREESGWRRFPLQPMTYALLDVRIAPSRVKKHPGTMGFISVGFWSLPGRNPVNAEACGAWTRLETLLRDQRQAVFPDPGMMRPAELLLERHRHMACFPAAMT